jgi:outer membrane protein TolC
VRRDSRLVPSLAHAQLADPNAELPADSLADFYGALDPVAVERWLVRRNPDVAAARAAMAAARARARSEGALPSPEIEAVIAPGTLGDRDTDAAYRFEAMQPLGLGRRGALRSVARGEAAAESARAAETHAELVLAARRAVIEYQEAEAARRALQDLRELLDQARRAALSRYAAGVATEADPLMAEMGQVRAEHEQVVIERDLELARVEINTLLHRPWNAPLPPPSSTLTVPWDPEPVETLVARALANRPELAEREAMVRAAEQRLRWARAEGWPDVALMAGYDRFMPEESMRPMVGVRLELPLWGGRIGAERDEARARLDEARARVRSVRDRIAHEVHRAWLLVRETAHEASLIEDSELPVSRRAVAAARAGYESGGLPVQSLLEAEREQLRVRLMQVRVFAEHAIARAELARAVGDVSEFERAEPAQEDGR